LLVKAHFISDENLEKLNQLTYWVGLPALLFYKIATAEYRGGMAMEIFLVVVIGMVGVLILGYVTAWLLRVPTPSIGTFVQAAFRGNLAFIGLPVLIYTSSGHGGLNGQSLETLGILVIAPMVPIYNLLSVLVLLFSQQKSQWRSIKTFLQPIITNPLVIASILGGAFVIFRWPLPLAISRTGEAIGQMALPLALISIGGALAATEQRGEVKSAVAASILKVAAAPIIGFYAAKFLGLGAAETRIALIYLACPTAAASYVLTSQIGGDDALAANAVVISTVLAMISLSMVLGLS
jgi:hypothetical protein